MKKFFDLDDEFDFGNKHINMDKTLRDVMDEDPEYIEFCLSKEYIDLTEAAENYWESTKHGGY